MNTIDRNKQVVVQFVEAVNQQRFEELDRFVAPDVVRHSFASAPAVVRSLDDLRGFLREELRIFPDARETIRFLVAEDDKVVALLDFRGTQHGAMGTFPPSGKVLEAPLICIYRLSDGRIAEIWVEWDNLGSLVQLGYLQPPR